MSLSPDLRAQLESLVKEKPVVLFMKGTRTFPQCGFSAAVVQILDEYLHEYETVNVLADPEMRAGIKVFSDWPTIPQLYVKGEFIGGCDIVRDMHTGDELGGALGAKPIEVEVPEVTLTEAAVAAFQDAAADQEYPHLRLEITPQFQHGLSFGPELPKDVVATSNGFSVRMDRATARRAAGMTVDFVEGPSGAGFKIDNPNEPPRVKIMQVEELKAKLEGDDDITVVDVRTPAERAQAHIEPSLLLDEGVFEELMKRPKDTPIVFYCATGARSQRAAQQFLMEGFTDVSNLVGGIVAWSAIA
jgi:monothiol glutaredoxin